MTLSLPKRLPKRLPGRLPGRLLVWLPRSLPGRLLECLPRRLPRRSPSCSDAHLAVAFFHVAHLLDAGLPVDEAIEDVQRLETRRRMRLVWQGLVVDVRSGENLSVAMRRWPGVFSSSVLAVVAAGEAAGKLGDAMHELESLLRWQAELRNRLAAVLAYPCFAVFVLLLVVLFLFTSVVPSLSDYLVSGALPLSWHTRWALLLSQSLSSLTWQPTLFAGLFFGVLLFALIASRRSRRARDAMIMKAPLIGDLLKSLWVSRYCQLVGTLYAAGVPLIDAMAHGEQVIGNKVLHERYAQARQSIAQGMTLMKAFGHDPLMPALFRRLVSAGESSGKLDIALLRCSNQLHRYASFRIERIEKLTGPVMLCVVGLLLIWIVVSILSPVYQTAIGVVIQ